VLGLISEYICVHREVLQAYSVVNGFLQYLQRVFVWIEVRVETAML
jgi:hypothetical protein